jgi:hypothetical protein
VPDIPILGDDAVLEDEGDGAILLKGVAGKTWDLKDTNLADGHAPKRQIRHQLEADAVDLGEGFLMQETPVLVQRDARGSIVRTTPLNELPGVDYYRGEIEEQAPSETPAELTRDERAKLIDVLALKLFNYYRAMPPEQAKYNPFYDGLPDLPAGSPEHLQPLPTTQLYPASDGQIYQWLQRFVGQRAQVINRNRFGKDNLQDLALRIE